MLLRYKRILRSCFLTKHKTLYILIGKVLHGKLLRKERARYGTACIICYHTSKRGVDAHVYLNRPINKNFFKKPFGKLYK